MNPGQKNDDLITLDDVVGFSDAQARAKVERANVVVARWRPGDPQGFNIAAVTPANVVSTESVVYPMSYDYRIEPLVLRRLEVLAVLLARRVVAVETPGVTMNFDDPQLTARSSIAPALAFRAIRGDFSGLAELQLTALREITNVSVPHSRLIGESLGAQSVVSIAAIHAPVSLDLVEPINCRRLSLLALARVGWVLGRVEEPLRERYAESSIESGWLAPEIFERSSPENAHADQRLKQLWRQGRWAIVSALGSRRSLLAQARALPAPTSLRVWRMADSTVCRSADAERFVAELHNSGVPSELLTLRAAGVCSGHHALTNLDALVGFALKLREQWSM